MISNPQTSNNSIGEQRGEVNTEDAFQSCVKFVVGVSVSTRNGAREPDL